MQILSPYSCFFSILLLKLQVVRKGEEGKIKINKAGINT